LLPALRAAVQGETWPSAIAGHVLDPLAQQKEQERIMLERFQREVGGWNKLNDGMNKVAVSSYLLLGLVNACVVQTAPKARKHTTASGDSSSIF
jgi:hypothetical protein